jgi:hypothetical protein
MADKVQQLPRYDDGSPKDDDGTGSYYERTLFTGCTLVMEWVYLDCPSTYLVVDPSALQYEHDDERYINDVNPLWDQLDNELLDILEHDSIVFDDNNSTEIVDIWHINGAEQY